MEQRPNYITPAGYAVLRAEYDRLFGSERPALVETIAWAAGNGDRSENGDYIYGRKRLREIDRRLGWLAKRMKAAKVVDPARAEDRSRVWFGATVTIADEEDKERVLTLVGDDEAEAGAGRVGWNAPIARALRGATVGDLRRVLLPAGEKEYEVVAIAYP
ncbi:MULTISPECIES: GreA/GreB family elongation factor [Sphingomonas]|uniref:Transcription elongation factor GreB n=1 Tax=Sphingomonas kyungheensis TaxID=1069987 RepID=A0ABU8H271_9SPHN|nr:MULTISPECIES: GreA/GreB family elongation factor [unclassified Sphingomonas]EZP48915.1 Transcript cleavage factor GreB [Sphingomonas sp. RIT328]